MPTRCNVVSENEDVRPAAVSSKIDVTVAVRYRHGVGALSVAGELEGIDGQVTAVKGHVGAERGSDGPVAEAVGSRVRGQVQGEDHEMAMGPGRDRGRTGTGGVDRRHARDLGGESVATEAPVGGPDQGNSRVGQRDDLVDGTIRALTVAAATGALGDAALGCATSRAMAKGMDDDRSARGMVGNERSREIRECRKFFQKIFGCCLQGGVELRVVDMETVAETCAHLADCARPLSSGYSWDSSKSCPRGGDVKPAQPRPLLSLEETALLLGIGRSTIDPCCSKWDCAVPRAPDRGILVCAHSRIAAILER